MSSPVNWTSQGHVTSIQVQMPTPSLPKTGQNLICPLKGSRKPQRSFLLFYRHYLNSNKQHCLLRDAETFQPNPLTGQTKQPKDLQDNCETIRQPTDDVMSI